MDSDVQQADPTLRTRQRLLLTLFAGSGINRTGFIAAITVGPLAADEILGSARWSGLANGVTTLGLALAVGPLAAYMARRGLRRPGFVGALSIAAVGAILSAFAVRAGSFPMLLAGVFVFGIGASGDRLSRYAAADVAPARVRASAISAVVWAGTIGSVAGPLLLAPSERLASALGFPTLAGGFLVAGFLAVVVVVLFAITLRPDPLTFAATVDGAPDETDATADDEDAADEAGADDKERVPLRPLLKDPLVRYSFAALIVGQFVMVLIMAMTPIHIKAAGEDLALVGLVIGGHTFGMYFFSPITGWLADRVGRIPVVVIGQVILVISALLAAPADGDDRALLLISLFLLGVGWNFGYVAASALVTDAATGAARVRLQGVADAVTWASGGIAAVSSGIILDWQSFSVLALAGAATAVAVLSLRLRYRGALTT